MPLWLDLLLTPMAAPETRRLRRMRRTWQLLCLAAAAVVGAFGWLHRLLGGVAACLALSLLVALALYSLLYLGRKHRADQDFLARSGSDE